MPDIVTRLGTLDVLILGVLTLGLTLGLFQGVLRQVFFLASAYFGIVLAAQYYLVTAQALATIVPGGEPRAYSTAGLLLTFVLAALSINALGYHVYQTTRLTALASADHLGGGVLGALSAWLFVSLFLTVVDFGLATPLGGLESAQADLERLLRESSLVPVVHHAMPAVYETLRPWVPAGLPAPFSS